jgi:hypothetical protein
VLERLREEGGFEDEVEILEKYSKGRLREAAGRSKELEEKVATLEAELAKRDEAPKRREAFEKYGIDFDGLRPAEKALLEKYDGELTDEAIADLVEANELPLREPDEGSDEESEEEPARKIADAARRAGANGSGKSSLSPADIADWPADRWVRFADANPDAAEALRQGKTVVGVTG